MLDFLLLLIAFVCFVIAAVFADRVPRVNLIAIGLAAWVLVPLIDAWPN